MKYEKQTPVYGLIRCYRDDRKLEMFAYSPLAVVNRLQMRPKGEAFTDCYRYEIAATDGDFHEDALLKAPILFRLPGNHITPLTSMILYTKARKAIRKDEKNDR